MSMTRMIALMACALVLSGVANAEIATVSQTLDYTNNGDGWEMQSYFWWPGEVIDHSPYYRLCIEDWGWTHDMETLVPTGATGIDAATVSILAWDIDVMDNEQDIIYADGTKLGILDGGDNELSTTTFSLPTNVLTSLWNDGDVDIFMDIDKYFTGNRVTIVSSTLAVDYIVGSAVPEPATLGLLGLGTLVMLRRRRS